MAGSDGPTRGKGHAHYLGLVTTSMGSTMPLATGAFFTSMELILEQARTGRYEEIHIPLLDRGGKEVVLNEDMNEDMSHMDAHGLGRGIAQGQMDEVSIEILCVPRPPAPMSRCLYETSAPRTVFV